MSITTLGVMGTKGGTGKSSTVANVGGLMADMGFRVLMIDTDPHAGLSKYYPLHFKAPNGIVELLLGDNSEAVITSTISNTVFPNLDIVLSKNLNDDVRIHVQNRVDRAFLLRSKIIHPYIQSNYDVVIFDTQGAVGPVQDAVAFASTLILSPVKPDVLSVREFLSGTQTSLDRLAYGSAMNLQVPPLRVLIYAQDRTKDARFISEELKANFNRGIDGRNQLLNTIIPAAKSYKESATLRVPVHCHERIHDGKSESALNVMTELVYELFPPIKDQGLKGTFFNEMDDLYEEYTPENDLGGAENEQ